MKLLIWAAVWGAIWSASGALFGLGIKFGYDSAFFVVSFLIFLPAMVVAWGGIHGAFLTHPNKAVTGALRGTALGSVIGLAGLAVATMIYRVMIGSPPGSELAALTVAGLVGGQFVGLMFALAQGGSGCGRG